MFDHLASEPTPIVFPVVHSLLYGDDQWLPGHQQWESLIPPWFPGCLSLDEIPVEPLDVQSRLEEIDDLIAESHRGVIDHQQSSNGSRQNLGDFEMGVPSLQYCDWQGHS